MTVIGGYFFFRGITAPFDFEKPAKARWAQSLFPLDDLRARSHPLRGYAPSFGRSIGSRSVFLHPQVSFINLKLKSL